MKGLPSHPNLRLHRRRWPGDVPRANLWYCFCRRLFQVTFVALWKLRVFNRHHEPASGSVLYVCNHQSYLDPMLMGLALRRPVNYMARDSLFRMPLFRELIRSVNAFPVRRASADRAALREALRRLRSGGQLAVFPEATRTSGGAIGPFLPGVALLAQRGADWTVPVLIDGAFECWPRTQPIPLPGFITVVFGRPMPGEAARRLSSDQFLAAIRGQLIRMQGEIRARLGKPPVRYDTEQVQVRTAKDD